MLWRSRGSIDKYSKDEKFMPVEATASEVSSLPYRDFSLVIGGPFYKLLRRVGLGTLRNIRRRAAVFAAITWLPLVALSLAQGVAFGKQIQIPLLSDFAVYGRFLICLPLLILAEAFIDPALNRAVGNFVNSELVQETEMSDFRSALERTARLRDSALPELVLFVLACAPVFLFFEQAEWVSGTMYTWRSTTAHGFTWAGWWFALVSTPIARFIIYRWIWRFLLWSALLLKLSRVNLHLLPSHPDYVGGLGFLAGAQERFGILFTALGAVMAGQIANDMVYEGERLVASEVLIFAFVVIALLIVLSPLLVFTPKLYRLKRAGLVDYGRLAHRHMQEFDRKWVCDRPEGERLLGNPDISSQADMSVDYFVIRDMRIVPVNKMVILQVAAFAVLPMIPLVLIAMPVEEVVHTVLKVLF
jgi:hypothetical protein